MKFKKNRLRLKRDIEKVMRLGKSHKVSNDQKNEMLLIKYYPHKEYTRFTVIVPKKVAKKSVWRNRIKRIIREAARQLIKEGKIPNYDIIFIVRQNIYTKKSTEIKKILQDVFRSIQ